MKNWKTTLTGVLTVFVSVGGAVLHWLKTGTLPDLTILGPAVMAGVGLIMSKDAVESK